MLIESQQAVIKLFNHYSLIVSEARYKTILGKGIPNMSASVARIKVSDHSNLKILSPKQMLQRLTKALAQVKVGNTSENLLNEIYQIKYSFYRVKEITKKVYNNIMN